MNGEAVRRGESRKASLIGWPLSPDWKDVKDSRLQTARMRTSDRGNGCVQAQRWEAAFMGSAGKRPMEMMPRESSESWRRRGKHSEFEAWEDECYFKCSGNLLKGFQWRRCALNHVRWCVKNRLSWSKVEREESHMVETAKCLPVAILPSFLTWTPVLFWRATGPVKSLFPIFLG